MKPQVLLLAIRPKTLGASIAPVVLGTAIAKSFVQISIPLFLIILTCAVLLQVGSNLVNDYFDYKKGADTEHRKGPLRVMSSGLMSENQMKNLIAAVFIAVFMMGCFLIWVGGWPVFFIGVASMICAFLYTAGPLPLAYLGLGDLFVFLFFGPVAVVGTFFLQVGRWELSPFLMSIPLGLLAVGILTVNNVRDFSEDKKSNKKTLVVRWGPSYGKIQYTICMLLPFILAIIFYFLGYSPRGTLTSLVLFLFSIPMIFKIWDFNDPKKLNPLLAQTSLLLTSFALFNSVAWYYNV